MLQIWSAKRSSSLPRSSSSDGCRAFAEILGGWRKPDGDARFFGPVIESSSDPNATVIPNLAAARLKITELEHKLDAARKALTL